MLILFKISVSDIFPAFLPLPFLHFLYLHTFSWRFFIWVVKICNRCTIFMHPENVLNPIFDFFGFIVDFTIIFAVLSIYIVVIQMITSSSSSETNVDCDYLIIFFWSQHCFYFFVRFLAVFWDRSQRNLEGSSSVSLLERSPEGWNMILLHYN